ncbi:hypothetical protein [Streptomyces sp. NPDC090022]|uniref:hypothetical protein n=1 Tax=Streptomyces sp. NPDC090022 TaxID=3365920 RepID=UPI00380E1104
MSELAAYMRGLTALLDPAAGWYGEFLRRDPDGVRACLDGSAIPPWDVVESLLQDLAATRGTDLAQRHSHRIADLRRAAVTAFDRRPGGAADLHALLASAAAERAAAEAAVRTLTARLSAAAPSGPAGRPRADRPEAADQELLAHELSWTRDDLARAAARVADLSDRLRVLAAAPEPPARTLAEAAAQAPADSAQLPGVPRQRAAAPGEAVGVPEPAVRSLGAARRLRAGRRSGGARYAGTDSHAQAPTGPPAVVPPPATGPRGARFGHPAAAADRTGPGHSSGAYPEAGQPAPDTAPQQAPRHAPRQAPQPTPQQAQQQAPQPAPELDGAAARSTGELVAELIALRSQGRTGEAHAVLCEAAAWPAGRLPGLAGELERAGLGADWGLLLWEAASLPPERLAAAAAALGEAGRLDDCGRLLRQGIARPADEIADAALALAEAGREREAGLLLDAFVRVRTAEEAARLARRDPRWFAPRLLSAARAVSDVRHRDLQYALRVVRD